MAYNRELFDCAICLQLLEDPVTTACGHSYCMKCINAFWDTNTARGDSTACPHCRQTFSPRPVLKKNALLAELVDQQREKTSRNANADADDDDDDDGDSYAAPGDVQCDVCTGRKRKACKFCCVCLASYCKTHLQPHVEVRPLQKHSLIPASAKFKENICSRHDKLLELYCHSDQQFLCLLCMVDEHKGHDTVTVTALECVKQRQLKRMREEIQDRVLSSERKMAKLNDARDSIKDAAWEVCDDFERLCAEHITVYVRSVERKCCEMREKVGEMEKAGVDWTNSHLWQLQREVSELRRKEDQLNQLLSTEDPIQFLRDFQALGDLPVFTDSHDRLDTLAEFVTTQKDKLKNMCNKEKKLFICSGSNVLLRVLRQQEEITSRTHLLFDYKNSRVEVDPHTVAACLHLSTSNTMLSWSDKDQGHLDHTNRFTYYHQALCTKGLEGNHYWEVEWDGGIVELAVSYKGINRKGSGKDCCFGHNHLSWKLTCSPSGCMFWHNNLHKGQIPPATSRRVGVRLEYAAGQLGFYSVSDPDRLTLLHQVQTTFTEPLYPGFSVDLGATLKICNI